MGEAAELIRRQTSPYQPSDIDDRYERRMREMIQAKLKGEGITPEAVAPTQQSLLESYLPGCSPHRDQRWRTRG